MQKHLEIYKVQNIQKHLKINKSVQNMFWYTKMLNKFEMYVKLYNTKCSI